MLKELVLGGSLPDPLFSRATPVQGCHLHACPQRLIQRACRSRQILVSVLIPVLHLRAASVLRATAVSRGGMVFTFLAARGLPTGSSLVEASKVGMARELEAAARQRGVKLLLPTDVVVAHSFPSDESPEPEHRVVPAGAIPDGWMVRTSMAYQDPTDTLTTNKALPASSSPGPFFWVVR